MAVLSERIICGSHDVSHVLQVTLNTIRLLHEPLSLGLFSVIAHLPRCCAAMWYWLAIAAHGQAIQRAGKLGETLPILQCVQQACR